MQQGKHAEIRSYYPFKRIFKTYRNSFYTQNEFEILNLLENANILNLNHILESNNTFSMDRLNAIYLTDSFWKKNHLQLIPALAIKIKHLHSSTKVNYGFYINHNDLFQDNIVIDKSSNEIILIDWGLACRSWTIYPDIASALIGILNNSSLEFYMFLSCYFGRVDYCNPKLLLDCLYPLIDRYNDIRISNNTEINSLNIRLTNAKQILKDIFNYE